MKHPHLRDVGMKLCSQFSPCRALTLSAYTLLSLSPLARVCVIDLSLQQGPGGIILTVGLLPGFPLQNSNWPSKTQQGWVFSFLLQLYRQALM